VKASLRRTSMGISKNVMTGISLEALGPEEHNDMSRSPSLTVLTKIWGKKDFIIEILVGFRRRPKKIKLHNY
jgi:hypothetical protein